MLTPLPNSYYLATAHAQPTRAVLRGEVTADVCVIGGGVAGCSTALHLAQRGYKVVVLEAEHVGHGASGRSGGQLIPGYSSGQGPIVSQLGKEGARALWDISVAAVQLTLQLIAKHHIDCDLRFGHLDVALKPSQRSALIADLSEFEDEYHYRSLRFINCDELHSIVDSPRYIAALYDEAAAHVHPLNYTFGLAQAAEAAGATMFEYRRCKLSCRAKE